MAQSVQLSVSCSCPPDPAVRPVRTRRFPPTEEDPLRDDDHRSEVDELERGSGTAARLFDVRTVIGGLFVVYGLLIGSAGLAPSEGALAKAQGVNINLWTGLGMLALGLAFLVWLKLRPLGAARPDGEDQPGR